MVITVIFHTEAIKPVEHFNLYWRVWVHLLDSAAHCGGQYTTEIIIDIPTLPKTHTPIGNGRFYAYISWIFHNNQCDTNLDEVKDLAKYPELVWINKYHYLFPYIVLVLIFVVGQWTPLLGNAGGLAAVVWGFCVATVVSLQGQLLVNAFAHGGNPSSPSLFSYRAYETSDTSRNNWLLCLVSLGTSWHNNHHRYMNSARAGFRWWELDLTYITLRVLAMLGLVWDLKEVPQHILNEHSLHSARLKKLV